ncbi:hypothetical protein [Amycolatopsis sp. GM8]|uniref:hypothetical protein n=1 Tax=Amycolatopsis sp. GM8 TaxID=2896530 RepID=UPI001F33F490|nr:hypothetical protein [Amycolatopsis sp. GM8]
MKTLSVCDIRLHPSTVDTDFEKAMVEEVLPGAGDGYPAGGVFTRALYRRTGEDFPPGYRCLVYSDRPGDSGFFGMRKAIEPLGAHTAEPWHRSLRGSADEEAALEPVRNSATTGLIMITVHRSLRLIPEDFEAPLDAALLAEVRFRTRVNNSIAAFWTRDDTAVEGRIEYLVVVFGQYMTAPRLNTGVLQTISDTNGVIVGSDSFRHVGTVAGDPAGKA